jgi:hypothetical protein
MAEQPDGRAASSGDGSASAAAPSGPPAPKHGFARRHWGKLTILGIIGIPLAAIGLWAAIALSYTYSTGTRTGYVQKLSRKGWVCKTWEGEIAMATAPGVSPQIFTFTMRSDSLAQALSLDMGKGRVAVEYNEHRGVPTSCFGDTPYFVTAYRLVTEVSAPPQP